jgi:ribonuclease HI
MKKKHLRSLSSVESWLKKSQALTSDAELAFETLRNVIEGISEDENDRDVLPPPAELGGDLLSFALYADGGCRGNPGPGAYAFVAQDALGKILAEGVEFESHTTNNKMELSGTIRGLEEIRDALPSLGKDALLTKIKVMTDSKYVVEGMKSWVYGWKARGWKKADNKVPENLELWQQLDSLRANFLEVEWIWVKGHDGHPQNEYCDRRANEAMDANLS